MKLKLFLMLCVSTCFISFPQNIIGCGPGIDPYDYYTSFFNPDISDNSALRPFYYTGYNFLYDEAEPVQTADILAEEWKTYCGNNVSAIDAKAFVMEYSQKDVSTLYEKIEKNELLKIPDSIKNNGMVKYFLQQKDMEALGYIMYAKKAEPFVTGDYNTWEPIIRDSLAMARLIKNGQQLLAAAKKELFKLKYGYQITRLAFYSGNNTDAIKFYDAFISGNKSQSVLQPLSLALKGGALFRTGNKKEAAYVFSKVFALADVKKVSNYQSFRWALDANADRYQYLQLCKSNMEKADMLALFAIGSTADETATIGEIASLNPNNKNLETLVAREINKLEESYFTPALNKQSGGKLFYYTWVEMPADSSMQAGKKQVENLVKVLQKLSENSKLNAGLYKTAAAYTALIIKDFARANIFLAEAKKLSLSAKANDQWMLTNLLLAVNQSKLMDAATEEKILPSIEWLRKKAMDEKELNIGYSNVSRWKIFYRNILAEAIAKKYHMQGDIYKEALAIGSADKVYSDGNYVSLDFLHNKTDIKDVEKMYALMNTKTVSNFENYLIKNNAITMADVTDFAGTAYLRNYEYKKAIDWLLKAGASKKDTIFKSAFIELLNDVQERLPTETRSTSKLSFAKEMLQTQGLLQTDKLNAAKYFYKLATGMYNITYYGHAWELVQYYRSGSDGYFIPANATQFQKQYYGCYAAHDMFKNAMDASTDKNFKAKCLFMMAKCGQKVVGQPQYNDFPNYENYQLAEKEFFPKFKNNKYFPQFTKEYAGTAFYKEAYSSCSYLRDFITKK